MEAIINLLNQDISSLIMGIFIVMSGIITAVSIIGRFSEIIGKPVKWIRKKNADHELLTQTCQELNFLREKHEESVKASIRHDEMIRSDLKKLTEIFVEKQITDYRWEIINFSNRVANGESCNKDSYRHCFATYEKYEKLLEENGMENGEVEISMEIVNDSYKQKLKQGF